ncbi:MAG: hypothetical protein JWP74_652 [Marmoricola sp.]|nr:hypothetical protein [Marmoricola sp.]
MELIEAQLSEFTQRSRSLVVRHAGAGLTRALEHGERVLVRSDEEFRTAVVVDIDVEADGTTYRLVLGGRLAAEMALDRLVGETDVPRHRADVPADRLSVEDVADMLARSGAAHRVPVQRQVARRLLGR